ncbi:hypothetical protein GWI33_020587 [Rhynchophorus ferrugineus]|uniref:Uncharacterized protein n=1 Tax=Rhynchophorus ferrugineus TaxID=354439 RepID=A0A834HU72_RHYFE|nr:hypothetical protein GWI33_020587 [Rhynchophorus ferrugineus]
MPPGPRRLSRANRSQNDGSCSKNPPITPAIEPPILPKHFPFPNIPLESDVLFDFLMAIFAIIGMGLQFLNMYKSVWWLPQSYTQNTMNFYLIDVNLVVFIIILYLRRLYYHMGRKLISKLYSTKSEEELSSLTRYILSMFYAGIVGMSAIIILGNQQKITILYLCYPFLVYVILFGLQVRPFFETVSWCSNGIPPIHACSSNPSDIRKECELLKSNFNDRIKQICFTSAVNAYYGGFVPFCFAQPQLVFDKNWCFQHVVFIFWSSFIFSLCYMLSLRYWDITHRSVLHLGMWEKVAPGRNVILVPSEWKDDKLWPGGVLVKYEKSTWRAMGDCNSNKPGDKSLNRYYKLCIRPSHLLLLVLILHSLMILYQMIVLIKTSAWYKIISVVIMLLFNYYGMYKVLRDFLVSYSFYKPSEDSGEEKDTFNSIKPPTASSFDSNTPKTRNASKGADFSKHFNENYFDEEYQEER